MKRKNQKALKHTIITIIPSKAYMRYWAFQISFEPKDSYIRRCCAIKNAAKRIVTMPVIREKASKPDEETRKVGFLGTKIGRAHV